MQNIQNLSQMSVKNAIKNVLSEFEFGLDRNNILKRLKCGSLFCEKESITAPLTSMRKSGEIVNKDGIWILTGE